MLQKQFINAGLTWLFSHQKLACWWPSYSCLWCISLVLCDGGIMNCCAPKLPTKWWPPLLDLDSLLLKNSRLCQSVAWPHYQRWSLFASFYKTNWRFFECKVFRGSTKISNQCSSTFIFHFKTSFFWYVCTQLYRLYDFSLFELFCLYWCIVLVFLAGINTVLEMLVVPLWHLSSPCMFAVMEGTMKVLGKPPGKWTHVHVFQKIRNHMWNSWSHYLQGEVWED